MKTTRSTGGESPRKQPITPHKGGRSAFIFGQRVTADEKALIKRAIEKSGLRAVEWLIDAARKQLGE